MSLFSVNTNVGALAALQSLDYTQEAENQAQNEVSTGQKVSSAADDPAIYAIANTINSNISGLSAVSDSLNFGAQIVSTASSGVASISTILGNLQQTVTQAGTSGVTLSTLQQSITADLQGINAYAADATFSGINLLNPTGATTNPGSTQINIVQNIGDLSPLQLNNQADVLDSSATQFTDALGLTNLSVLGVQNSSASAANIGANISFGSASTIATTFVSTAASTNQVLTLSTTSGGVTTNYNFEFLDTSAASTSTQLQTKVDATDKAIAVDFNSTTDSPNTIVAKLATALESQGFGVVAQTDGSLNIVGNNLTGIAYGSATGGAAPAETATVTSSTTTAQTDATSGVTLSGLSTAAAAVTTVQSAISDLNTVAVNLGALSQQITGIQNFTSALSSALTAGVGALTDADLAAESAKLSSLQTKQQLATQSLTIANQAPQVLLTLFKNL
jgi:flagellin